MTSHIGWETFARNGLLGDSFMLSARLETFPTIRYSG